LLLYHHLKYFSLDLMSIDDSDVTIKMNYLLSTKVGRDLFKSYHCNPICRGAMGSHDKLYIHLMR